MGECLKEFIVGLLKVQVIETKKRKFKRKIITKYLIRWNNILTKDATWEGPHFLEYPSFELLEGKINWLG